MNLKEEWQSMETTDHDLSALLQPGFSKHVSTAPMVRIKKNLLNHSLLAIGIIAFYVAVIWRFPVWQVVVCIGAVLLYTVWAVVNALLLYRRLDTVRQQYTLLQEMRHCRKAISRWMQLQEQAGLFIYPIAAAGGFMIGGSLGAGKSIGSIMQAPLMQVLMIVVTLLLVPPCFYLARWMNRKAFGQYAQQLSNNIASLTADEH